MSYDDLCPSWDGLCPDGRTGYYEGDDPEGFAAAMRDEFGIDVTESMDRGPLLTPSNWDQGRSFVIPPGLVEAVLASERWPVGT